MENSFAKMIVDKQLDIEVLSLFGRMEKIPSHFHDYYEIGFIEHGNRRVVCQNKEYIVGANDLMIFNPNDSHTCFIESIKTTQAKNMLRNGMDVIDVTYQLGFSSQSHFTNFFKKNTGVTPKQYKHLYRN